MEDFHFYFRDVHINSCLLNLQPISRGKLRLSECLRTYTFNIFPTRKKKKNPIIEQSGVKKKKKKRASVCFLVWNKRSRGCIGNRAAAKALLSQ